MRDHEGQRAVMDPIADTASTHLTRLVLNSARRAGVAADQLATVTGTDPKSLAGESNRIPLRSLLRLWELLAHARPGPGTGIAVTAAAPLGTLTTWDYLVTNGPVLADALRAAQPYHRLVTADVEGFELRHDGELIVEFRTTAADPAVAAVINEYVLAYYLRRAREATGRPVVPALVTFGHPAPGTHKALTDAFGTNRIEFDAPRDSITFTAADAVAPIPRADPLLAELLRSHAELVLATARPIPGPLEAFRTALAAELTAGSPSLGSVAARLAISPRTLQRHLAEHGTTWRGELDRLRHERVRELLAQGNSTIDAVARRVGFADDRALRRAYRRWTGNSPTADR
ncbi:AraC family transcriptional regulator [Nocardia sp. CDC159]|uniref:AraC family transcriptional regulator n=1 Tax=Nocardia pulmonis TaxID=2951408 RepID=A0A9X2EIR3_9NOCA|nr:MULTISPECIES: AraC family transcriptional regulator [Nocardia]MCM6778993.1 AraC family transcriptional regulator [Nocardia pulmonis]MCM6791868.1 AraC family transcriptional regulator [Nocardia sp. CDC159]